MTTKCDTITAEAVQAMRQRASRVQRSTPFCCMCGLHADDLRVALAELDYLRLVLLKIKRAGQDIPDDAFFYNVASRALDHWPEDPVEVEARLAGVAGA